MGFGMATGKQWREHFEKMTVGELRTQRRVTSDVIRFGDKMIIREFQLEYLNIVNSILGEVLNEKMTGEEKPSRKKKAFGGVF